MHRTPTRERTEDVGVLIRAQLERTPEYASWLGLLELALDALDQPVWSAHEPQLPPEREDGAPLLHEATLYVEPRPARRWVRRLLKTAAREQDEGAASLAGLRARRLDPLALLEAAASGREDALHELSGGAADERALGAVAQLATLPLLFRARERLQQPAGWQHGYCPTCGGWPVLAELRGLERKRRLRCGRCGDDWGLPVLLCPFCGERDHKQLPSLLPEGQEQERRIDACRSCHGYLKTFSTLAALPPWGVPLRDVETLDLDVAAVDRGYRHPQGLGRAPRVRVASAGGMLAGRTGWA